MVRAHPDIPGLVEWQPLARGGFSTVWQARQESLDRLVAVKVDHRPLHEEKERRRFLREAGAAGRLSTHPGIVTVHDAGILSDGRPYLVMDLCTGGSLTRWLKPESRQDERRIRDVGVRIADALAAAHARGVLHRDVKPANILIDAYDHPGLADFGLAAMPEAGMDLSVTLEGMTPAYAPGEVFYLKPPTAAGDVYSLAATLYALLDGKPPRWPDTGTPSLPELLELQRQPVDRLPHVDDEFMDVLLAALDDDPERRPSAAEFRDQLAALRFAGPVRKADPPAAAAANVLPAALPAARSGVVRRRALLAVLVAAVVVAGLFAAMMFNWGGSPGRAAAPVPAPGPAAASTTGKGTGTPTSPRPVPTRATPSKSSVPPLPEGFVDCSKQLGSQTYCVSDPECWRSVSSFLDSPRQGYLVDCKEEHTYQTFAAGVLSTSVVRQSELEKQKAVKRVCTRDNLNRMLVGTTALKDWEVFPLPPQLLIRTDDFYRCVFGNGNHKGVYKLEKPR